MRVSYGVTLGVSFVLVAAGMWTACASDDPVGGNSQNATDGGGADTGGGEGDTGGGEGDTGGGADTGGGEGDTGGGGADTGGGEGDAGGGGPDTGGGGADTGAGDAPGGDGGASLCESYCTAIMAACTGSVAQYFSKDGCLKACALLPNGNMGDNSGNTVGCRLTHAGLAEAGSPGTHCPHAGAFGGGTCGTSRCEPFCAIAIGACPGVDAGAGYTDQPSCLATCGGFAGADGGGVPGGGENTSGPTGGNNIFCRQYHLLNALDNPVIHCKHPAATSSQCM